MKKRDEHQFWNSATACLCPDCLFDEEPTREAPAFVELNLFDMEIPELGAEDTDATVELTVDDMLSIVDCDFDVHEALTKPYPWKV